MTDSDNRRFIKFDGVEIGAFGPSDESIKTSEAINSLLTEPIEFSGSFIYDEWTEWRYIEVTGKVHDVEFEHIPAMVRFNRNTGEIQMSNNPDVIQGNKDD